MTLRVYSKDVDKLWEDALAASATVAMPLDNVYWGERYGQLTYPFGNLWSVAMRVSMSKEEMVTKQREAIAMFDNASTPEKSPDCQSARSEAEPSDVLTGHLPCGLQRRVIYAGNAAHHEKDI